MVGGDCIVGCGRAGEFFGVSLVLVFVAVRAALLWVGVKWFLFRCVMREALEGDRKPPG